jgi:hypothetical protein
MTTLTTGWEPGTATTDTFLRQYLFGWAQLCEVFTTAAGGRTIARDTFAATDYRRPAGYFNSATLLAPVGVEVVTDPTGLADWERVAIEGYPLPELLPVVTGALAGPALLADARLRFTLSRQGGAPVSLGCLFTTGDLGIFTLGVTCPAARRRGHWLAHAAHRLTAVPRLWTAGVFSDHSRPSAQRLGFVPVLRLTLWSLPRPR